MTTFDLEEQEQLSAIKAWWEQNGTLITWAVVAVAAAVVAYYGWNWYQRKQAAQASAIYGTVLQAEASKDAKKAKEAAGALLENYSGTSYAAMAALLSAKVQFETGDLKTARAQLAWAVDNAKDQELKDLARLRLAQVMSDEKAYDDALKQLDREPLAPYAARYAELRGDIYAAQGKRAEAQAAYQAALAKLDARPKTNPSDSRVNTAFRELVQLKLEALGGGQ
jgi:predicted negative regulator of RcsB-dependent stress response